MNRSGRECTTRSLFAILLAIFCFAPCAYGQQRPLITEDVDIIKPGTVRLQLGFDFTQGKQFGLSGLKGDLTRIGVVGVNVGLAPNVEFQLQGVMQNYLSIKSQGPTPINLDLGANPFSTHDTGDFALFMKMKLRGEDKYMPAIGFRFGVILPNSNQARGIGSNTTNFLGTILLGKRFGNLNAFANVGIGILTAPTQPFSQNDVILYGLGAIYKVNDRLNLAGEVNGCHSTRKPFPGTEDESEARLGFQLRAAGLVWDAAGTFGLTKFSPKTGITFGFTYDAKTFTPTK